MHLDCDCPKLPIAVYDCPKHFLADLNVLLPVIFAFAKTLPNQLSHQLCACIPRRCHLRITYIVLCRAIGFSLLTRGLRRNSYGTVTR